MTDWSISNCVRLIEGTPVLLAEKRRDLFVGDEAELDEIQAKLAAVGFLIVQRLLQLRRSDALFLQKQVADADRHRCNSEIACLAEARNARRRARSWLRRARPSGAGPRQSARENVAGGDDHCTWLTLFVKIWRQNGLRTDTNGQSTGLEHGIRLVAPRRPGQATMSRTDLSGLGARLGSGLGGRGSGARGSGRKRPAGLQYPSRAAMPQPRSPAREPSVTCASTIRDRNVVTLPPRL